MTPSKARETLRDAAMEAKRQATTLVHFVEGLPDEGAELFLRALIAAGVIDRDGRLRFAIGVHNARQAIHRTSEPIATEPATEPVARVTASPRTFAGPDGEARTIREWSERSGIPANVRIRCTGPVLAGRTIGRSCWLT